MSVKTKVKIEKTKRTKVSTFRTHKRFVNKAIELQKNKSAKKSKQPKSPMKKANVMVLFSDVVKNNSSNEASASSQAKKSVLPKVFKTVE